MSRNRPGTATARRFCWQRRWRGLMAAALLAPGLGGAATPTAPEHAPAAWLTYAQLVSRQLQLWYAQPTSVARELRHYVATHLDTVPEPLEVALWFNARGRIDRLEFDSLGDTKANDALRTLWTEKPVAEAPPPRMRQPLVLRVHLQKATPDDPAAHGQARPNPATAPDQAV